MLTHIVCWKYKDETTGEERADHVGRLRRLPDLVPGIERFEVGVDILHLDRSFDTALVATFADREALDVYTDHPEHVAVAAFGKRVAEKVVSVDFVSDDLR